MVKNYLINASHMTNDNFIGFHKDIIKNAGGLTYKEAIALLTSYTDSVQKFSDYISSLAEAEAKHSASLKHAERKNQFNNFRNYVHNLCNHPNEELRAVGASLWEMLKDFGSKAAKNQVAVTSMIERTLDRVKLLTADEKVAAVYTGSELETWVNALTEHQENFRKHRDIRWVERVNRLLTTGKDLREECMGHFHRLYNYAEYVSSVKGDAACGEFVSCVKAVIAANKDLCYSRPSKKSDDVKKDDDENKATPADSTAAPAESLAAPAAKSETKSEVA